MPIGTSEGYGVALGLQNLECEREIAELMQAQQARQAASDFTAGVSPRFRMDVSSAQSRLLTAERALDAAATQARLRIARERPSEALANVWHEEMTLSAAREVQAAKAALAAAELRLGQQVQARRALDAFLASEAAAHAEIDAACQQRHAALHATKRRLAAALLD